MTNETTPRGCLQGLLDWLLKLFGFTRQRPGVRSATVPLDQKYREFVDQWTAETLGRWLHETRNEIDADLAAQALTTPNGGSSTIAAQIRETLIDAKVTFTPHEANYVLQVEAYTAPRQTNGKVPEILRWRAERPIAWVEIPDDVREHLIRQRQPITLAYALPED